MLFCQLCFALGTQTQSKLIDHVRVIEGQGIKFVRFEAINTSSFEPNLTFYCFIQPANYYEVQFSVLAIGYKVADKGSTVNPSLKLPIDPYPEEDKEPEEEEEGKAETRAEDKDEEEDKAKGDKEETKDIEPITVFDMDGDYHALFEKEKWITIK